MSSWATAMQEIVLLNRAGMNVGTHLYFEMEREEKGLVGLGSEKDLKGRGPHRSGNYPLL